MLRNALSRIYDVTIRKYLPRQLKVYNGFAAPSEHRLLDVGYEPAFHGYEVALCDAVRRTIQPNDGSVVIGGGRGISSILCAEHAYPGGTVDVFEASVDQCRDIRTAVEYHGSGDRVTVHHAAIGEIRNAYGRVAEPTRLAPADLPSMDVLVMDCEGAERTVLDELYERPRAIVVETHGCFDSPTDVIMEELEQMGYTVELSGWEDKSRDIAILTATQCSSDS